MLMPNTSLITSDDRQLKLPLSALSDQMDDAFFLAEESKREFTGARLFSKHPETYRAVVTLLAEGLGVIRIGKILGVSPNTVLAVREREGANVDIEKKRLSDLSRATASMLVEGIVDMLSDSDRVAKMSLKDRGIVFGILSEKSELLAGNPTARLAVEDGMGLEDYLRMMREAAAQTGLGEEKKGERVADGVVVAPRSQPGATPALQPALLDGDVSGDASGSGADGSKDEDGGAGGHQAGCRDAARPAVIQAEVLEHENSTPEATRDGNPPGFVKA
jgi:hypothetical protein